MRFHLITYDLHQPGRDYEPVWNFLRSFTYLYHPLGSVWFVGSDWTAVQLRDALRSLVDANDSVLCIEVTAADWATWNVNNAAWLNNLQSKASA